MAIKDLTFVILKLEHAEICEAFCSLFLECIIFIGEALICGKETSIVLLSLGPSPSFDEKFGIIP